MQMSAANPLVIGFKLSKNHIRCLNPCPSSSCHLFILWQKKEMESAGTVGKSKTGFCSSPEEKPFQKWQGIFKTCEFLIHLITEMKNK